MKVTELVHLIKTSSSLENALEEYTGVSGFGAHWVTAIYKSKREFPDLDKTFDVNLAGKNALGAFGINEDTQSLMWEKWSVMEDERKASWVDDWKKINLADNEEVKSFLLAITKFLI